MLVGGATPHTRTPTAALGFSSSQETMGNCSGPPKTRRSSSVLESFFFPFWHRPEVSRRFRQHTVGAFVLTSAHSDGGYPKFPCLRSHDSMRALCVSWKAVLFLSIHVIHRMGGKARLCRGPAFTHPTETTNPTEPRTHLTQNWAAIPTERPKQQFSAKTSLLPPPGLHGDKDLRAGFGESEESGHRMSCRLKGFPPRSPDSIPILARTTITK